MNKLHNMNCNSYYIHINYNPIMTKLTPSNSKKKNIYVNRLKAKKQQQKAAHSLIICF